MCLHGSNNYKAVFNVKYKNVVRNLLKQHGISGEVRWSLERSWQFANYRSAPVAQVSRGSRARFVTAKRLLPVDTSSGEANAVGQALQQKKKREAKCPSICRLRFQQTGR